MNLHRMILLALFSSVLVMSQSKIIQMGHLNAGELKDLTFNKNSVDDCLEYTFMTNYKKILFELLLTPSTDTNYKQRVILSDFQFSTCPQKCREEPNYCTVVSNQIYSKTEAMFSKWFPKLYVYIVNLPTFKMLNMLEQEDNNVGKLDLKTTQLVEERTTDKMPIFSLLPVHLPQGCQILNDLVPQCASLSAKDCINPELCTTECDLLTCQADDGSNLFSLWTPTSFTAETLTGIWSAHSKFNEKYSLGKCMNPIPYYPTLADTAASILLLCLAFMGGLITCVCIYNLRLNKTNQEPCDICMFCPEWLFPKAIKDNPLYQEDGDDEF